MPGFYFYKNSPNLDNELAWMKRTNTNTNLTESYFAILKNLSTDAKLGLITMLSKSIKSAKPAKSLKSLYGALISEKSADELIKAAKDARTFNRKRE